MTTKIIDTHTHVVSPDRARYPTAPLGGKQSDWSSERPLSVDGLLVAMDEAGVSKAVVVQASTAYGHDNRCVADAVGQHPDRLVGVFSVDVLAPDAAEHIRHWHGRGFAGFRLFTTGTTMPGQAGWIDDPRGFAGWETAQELRLPIAMQMTAQGIPALRAMMDRFPGVPVLLDHLARPELGDGPPYAAAGALMALAAYPQVVLKLTTRALDLAGQGASTPAALLEELLRRFGARRVMWGSNFPAHAGGLPHLVERSLEALSSLGEADRAEILSGTAQRVYPALGER